MISALLGEDFHGGNGADVGLTGSALCCYTLEDFRADDVTATWLGAVAGTASSTLPLDLDGFGVGDFFLNFVGNAPFGAGIHHTLYHFVFDDFLGAVGLLFAANEAAA